ncbi:hypothetical protein [Coraliomargarita parva]|uniref:hypothetical protein n=1 Tax=Coraliomargarita parva TaxID=3014050 RepID=UPI0022B3EB5F|nr:hypothetical protein [Coraliomargarita parva]
MKTLIGSLYIAAVLSGLAGLWFSVVPTLSYLFSRFDGDFTYRPLESFIYREGVLFMLSLGVLMVAHIGVHLAPVFDSESCGEDEKEALSNLSGTPWDPKRKAPGRD